MRRGVLAAGILVALAAAGCGQRSGTDRSTLAYGQLPMQFERNVGQAGPQVRYLARGAGYALLLTDRAPVLALARRHASAQRLRLGLAGTSPRMRLAAAGPRTGTVNDLVGPRERWHENIPAHGAVRYVGAYPGIDVAFHGTSRSLEFDFEVAPGADPGQIALAPRGQRSWRLDRSGALVLRLRGGTVREAPPRSHQVLDGRLRPVASRFVVRPGGRIGIRVGAYDHRRALTIDPVLTYSTYLGGSSFDLGMGIAVDAAGAAYVAGTTASAGFPTTAGAQQTTFGGNQDAFVTKLAPDGHAFVYSTFFGGAGIDIANDVAVDAAGAAYVVGSTTSADLPTTAGAFRTALGGGTDAFAAKLSPSGAALVYSTYVGGTVGDSATGVAVDAAGGAVLTGSTSSANFPVTAGTVGQSYNGSGDAFVTKLAPTGNSLAWSTYLGGASADLGFRVVVDGVSAVYIAGRTQSSGFPHTANAPQAALRGTQDGFITKLSSTGDNFVYSTFLGGSGSDDAEAIAVDGSGAAYVTGSTASSDFPVTSGAAQTAFGGGANDAYAAKLAPGGGSVPYATLLGGAAGDQGHAVAVDAAHELLVAGQTTSTDFPTGADAVQTAYPGGATAAFMTRISPAGDARTYSTFLGGSAGSAAAGLALDAGGAAYMTGSTSSGDFPVTAGAAQGTNGGSSDAFAAKLVPPAAPVAATTETTTTVAPPAVTTTTPEPPPTAPTIVAGPPRVTWNRVSVAYRLVGGVAVLFEVITPRGRAVAADLRSGVTRGTLHWDRRAAGRVAPPGRYHLTLTASSPDGGQAVKHLGVTLKVLYAHTPRIHAGAARISYELTQPATVTLSVARPGARPTVVASAQGRRGANQIAWDLLLHGRRVAGGAYRLALTARTRAGATVRVAVPAGARR